MLLKYPDSGNPAAAPKALSLQGLSIAHRLIGELEADPKIHVPTAKDRSGRWRTASPPSALSCRS